MSETENWGQRSWQVIAEELSHATDSERVLELSRELNQALAEQGRYQTPPRSPHPPIPLPSPNPPTGPTKKSSG